MEKKRESSYVVMMQLIAMKTGSHNPDLDKDERPSAMANFVLIPRRRVVVPSSRLLACLDGENRYPLVNIIS